MMNAADVIRALDLRPHPEGGFFRETFRDPEGPSPRGWSTAIYYLLGQDERSHWHKVDASELWLFHAGDPLELSLSPDGRHVDRRVLGVDFASGALPQVVVPAGWWQSAAPLGTWTLVSCTVSPGFEFRGFEMAQPDWRPTEP
jgi:predicted cupin superfamily sugar epimerase